MSGTAGVANTFANAVTATGAQLDANYGTIVAYINDPTNRNNFATDGAATNTVALTFSPAVVGGYTTGLELTWKWGATNTGAVVLNANGLGNANLVNPDGTALAAGQGVIGSVGKAVYDGTRFIYMTGFAAPASQAQMTAAANLTNFVPPGRMLHHPLMPKAIAVFNGTNTGTITPLYAFNVASILRLGTGSYGVTFTNAYANTSYGVGGHSSASIIVNKNAAVALTTTSASITTFSAAAGGVVDDTYVVFLSYGALP